MTINVKTILESGRGTAVMANAMTAALKNKAIAEVKAVAKVKADRKAAKKAARKAKAAEVVAKKVARAEKRAAKAINLAAPKRSFRATREEKSRAVALVVFRKDTVKETAKKLDRSESSIRNWVRDFKLGKLVLTEKVRAGLTISAKLRAENMLEREVKHSNVVKALRKDFMAKDRRALEYEELLASGLVSIDTLAAYWKAHIVISKKESLLKISTA